jgi:hypothetical protein
VWCAFAIGQVALGGGEGETDHRESREYQAGGGDAVEDDGVVARDCGIAAGGGGVVCDIVGV